MLAFHCLINECLSTELFDSLISLINHFIEQLSTELINVYSNQTIRYEIANNQQLSNWCRLCFTTDGKLKWVRGLWKTILMSNMYWIPNEIHIFEYMYADLNKRNPKHKLLCLQSVALKSSNEINKPWRRTTNCETNMENQTRPWAHKKRNRDNPMPGPRRWLR